MSAGIRCIVQLSNIFCTSNKSLYIRTNDRLNLENPSCCRPKGKIMPQRLVKVFDVYGTLLRPLSNMDPQVSRLAEIVGRPDQLQLVRQALERHKSKAEIGEKTAKIWLEGVLYELNCNYGWRYVYGQLVQAMAHSHELTSEASAVLGTALASGQAGIISNVSPVGERVAKEVFQLSSRYRPGLVTVYSSSSRCSKPDPACYRLVADNLSRPPEECLYVDDSLECVIGALASGMRAALVLHDYGATAGILRDRHQLSRVRARLAESGGRANLPLTELQLELPPLLGLSAHDSITMALSLRDAVMV